MEDDDLDEIVIPECHDGILSIKGDYYLSRKLKLDDLESGDRMIVAKDVVKFVTNMEAKILILNFHYVIATMCGNHTVTLYKTRTRMDMICKILTLMSYHNPITIDINDNMFFETVKLQNTITSIQGKGFTIKCAKIYLHHSLHENKN